MMLARFRRISMIAILLLMLTGILFSVITFIRGDWRLSYDEVRIAKLLVCEEPNKIASSDNRGSQIISSHSAYLYACGQLKTNTPIPLHFYLFRETNSKSEDSSPPGLEFEEGFFNQDLQLPAINRQGRYRIDVYLFRNIIATTTFEVIGP